jgi:hypothetical protein
MIRQETMMSTRGALTFSIEDVIDGQKISPKTISFALFNEFNEQVARFVRGGNREIDLSQTQVEVTDGSYALRVILGALALAAVEPDFALLHQPDGLGEMDPKRAEVVAQWQEAARRNPQRVYQLTAPSRRDRPVRIDHTTDLHRREDDQWVTVEKYVFGHVLEAGGKKPNLHLEPEGGGKILIVAASEDQLRGRTPLFYDAMLHVMARQNLRTGELDQARLLDFADYHPAVDEAALDKMVERGTKAWRGVRDAGKWVEEQRGNAVA